MRLAALTVCAATITACEKLTPPELTHCSIINRTTAECVRGPEIYDKPIREMRGFTCMSPEDVGDAKTYLLKVLDRLTKTVQRLNQLDVEKQATE